MRTRTFSNELLMVAIFGICSWGCTRTSGGSGGTGGSQSGGSGGDQSGGSGGNSAGSGGGNAASGSIQQFARKLVGLLRRAPETPSAAEVCVRRCYFAAESGVREGFYCTLYVSGYGNDGASARRNWEVALKLMGNAIVQLSAFSATPGH